MRTRSCLLVLVLLSSLVAPMAGQAAGGEIDTVAGGGVLDGVPATETGLDRAFDVALDEDGNLYIAERGARRIRVVREDGTIDTFAGNGGVIPSADGVPARQASIGYVSDLHTHEGIVYFAGGNQVRAIDGNGTLITVAGTGDYGYTGDGGPGIEAMLGHPYGLAMDDSGALYIADGGADVIRKVDPSGVITTVAGTGTWGFTGDGGPATSARLSGPQGVAVASDGTLYIADSGNGRIRTVDADGNISTFAGDGSDSLRPSDVEIGDDGAIYVADEWNSSVWRYDDAGRRTSVTGDPLASIDGAPARLAYVYPEGIAVGPLGEVYMAELSLVRRVDRDLSIRTVAGNGRPHIGDGGAATDAAFLAAEAITVTADGSIYIADGPYIRKVDPGGTITRVAGRGDEKTVYFPSWFGNGGIHAADYTGSDRAIDADLHSPRGLAPAPDGDVYVSDSYNNRIVRITEDGRIIEVAGTRRSGFSGDGGPAREAEFDTPSALTIGPDGALYVTDWDNLVVRRIDPDSNVITTVAGTGEQGHGGDGGLAIRAQLNPGAVAVDSTGNLFIADQIFVRRVDADGVIQTVAGTSPGCVDVPADGEPVMGRSVRPDGLAIAADGSLLVADRCTHSVRRIDAHGIISTVAGTGIPGLSGDGGSAAMATFYFPSDLVRGPEDALFVFDAGNDRVRRIAGGAA